MKKLILFFILLTLSANAQYESALRREQVRNINLALQTDSAALFRLPPNVLITRCVTFIDTVTANLDSVKIALSEENTILLSWKKGETDISRTMHISRPDYLTAKTVNSVIRYTTTGSPATGRIRVWIEYVEVY